MTFRVLGSALYRQGSRTALRSTSLRQPALVTSAKFQASYPIWRSFAAEAGFPDKDDVKNRVLEVVRKFEKVRGLQVLHRAIGDRGLICRSP